MFKTNKMTENDRKLAGLLASWAKEGKYETCPECWFTNGGHSDYCPKKEEYVK